MDFDIIAVPLNQIETTDHTFKISTETDFTELALSISAIGLLQPPVLIGKGPAFIVVSGYRRVAACQAIHLAGITARVLHPDSDRMQCAQIAVAENSFQRTLNVVEQSRAFALLQRTAGEAASWLKIAQSTGLPASQTARDRILPVAGMPAALQAAILEGSLALPVALHIHRFNSDDAMALCRFFRKITTGLNIQRELLEVISEICRRDDIPIAEFLQLDEITQILDNQAATVPQNVQQLRLLLKAKRFPELSKAEAAFHRELKALKLDPRIQLLPPRFFEGKSYRLTVCIDSRRQLHSLQPEFEKLVRHTDLLPE
jgi:ParB family chromosome partitioning protein